MKKIYKVFLIILVTFLFCVSYSRTTAQANDEIVFKDKSLEKALCKYYEWDGKFTKEKASELSEKESLLVIENAGISDLEGLQYFDNLGTIYLGGNNLRNLKPLTEIKSLGFLILNDNSIKGKEFEEILKDAGRIKNLSTLELNNNDLTSLDFLDILVDKEILEYISLENNKISDISILKKYNYLYSLDLKNNRITDVRPLEHLDKLTFYLDLSDNCIIDYFPIKHIFDTMFDDACGLVDIVRYDYSENPVDVIYDLQIIEFPYLTTSYMNQPYAEATSLLKTIGGSAEYDKNTGILTCKYNGKELILKDFTNNYTLNGINGKMNYEMRRMQYNIAYIPVEDLCSILGLGYKVIDPTEDIYSWSDEDYDSHTLIEISSNQTSKSLKNGDFTYEVTSQGIRIIKYNGSDRNVVIPSEIDGHPVTCISDFAFSNNEVLMSVEIPGSVIRIGTGLGYGPFASCINLKKVTIKNGSKDSSIGAFAFFNCISLTRITIPGNYITLNDSSFEECTELKEVLWKQGSSSIHKIGKNAFSNCQSLTAIDIPEGTKYIGSQAFQEDSSLTSVTIPSTIQVIGIRAFYNCTGLTSVTMKGSVQNAYIEDEAFKNCAKLKKLRIPEGFSVIRNYVFENDTSLITVTLPSTLTAIGDWAFDNCTKLQTVTIPTESKVLTLEDTIFMDCTSLKSIYIGDLIKFEADPFGLYLSYDSKTTLYSNNKKVINEAKDANMKTSSPPTGYINGKSLFGSLQLVGTSKVGHKLSTNMDAVAPINAAVSYKWTIGGKVVSTTDSYTIKKSDTGKKLTLTITGKNAYIGSLSTSVTVK